MRILVFGFALILMASTVLAQAVDPGRQPFETRCARCHGADGNGGEMGPSILLRLPARDDQQLASVIRDGLPGSGMPPQGPIADPEMSALVKFLRTIERRSPVELARRALEMVDGRRLEGLVVGEGFDDLQLRTPDGHVHLLRRAGTRMREVTSETAWPTYNGDPGGNRYTTLTQINKANITRLAPKWVFTIPGTSHSQV